MKTQFLLLTLSLSSLCFGQQIGNNFSQNPYSDSYYVKPSQTILNANVKLKKIPGIEFKLDSLHTGTDLSQSQRHAIQMGYNLKTPIGALNLSANNTKMPGYLDDKKSLSASYLFKNNWSALNLSYENNNYLDPKANKFSDPVFKVSGSFIF
jgi:outer membrane usher protein FimD/PapC